MNRAKLMEVNYAVDAYQKLKETFVHFASICEQELSKDNEFKVEYISFNELIISIRIFDNIVELSLSMVVFENDPALGLIVFNHVINENNRKHLMSIYFDELGNTKNTIDGHSNMYNLTRNNCLAPILLQLLDSYINIYFRNSQNSSPKAQM